MKPRKLYSIEYLLKHNNDTEQWLRMFPFTSMQKSFGEGAWSMLKTFYGGSKQYRLVDNEGTVVDKWNTGEIQVN